MGFWSLMTALTGLAQGFWHLMTARMLVAVGEAGGVPAAHSLISELTPEHRRPMALAIHSAGVPLGALIGLAGGGLLADALGWRVSFAVLGVLGLPVALLVLVTLPEPRTRTLVSTRPPAGVPGVLLRRRSFQLLMAGFALGAFAMSGLLQWLPSYFTRTFSMPVAAVGVQFGLSYGLGAIGGMLAGGTLATGLMQRDTRWALRLASLSYVAAFPPLLGVLLVADARVAMGLVFLGTACASMAYGPAYAMIQTIAPVNLRGFASAFSLFVANFIGAGLGPLAVGVLSDLHGNDPASALRYALLTLLPIFACPAVLYGLASRAFGSEVVRT
jgi:predicted MFS family arabinose efflux permease